MAAATPLFFLSLLPPLSSAKTLNPVTKTLGFNIGCISCSFRSLKPLVYCVSTSKASGGFPCLLSSPLFRSIMRFPCLTRGKSRLPVMITLLKEGGIYFICCQISSQGD